MLVMYCIINHSMPWHILLSVSKRVIFFKRVIASHIISFSLFILYVQVGCHIGKKGFSTPRDTVYLPLLYSISSRFLWRLTSLLLWGIFEGCQLLCYLPACL